jgi:DNA-binding CsgD family transcriptional regulator
VPGFLVLAPDGTMEMANRDADHWLGALGVDSTSALPAAVVAVADRARSGDGRLATARVRSPDGPGITVRGSLLGDGPDARVAIHLEAARAPELAPLIAATWGLTERERNVTELVARGHTTSEIASHLEVSAYTVQDHLKAIFEKSGTGSRGELVARLFLDHQRPKLSG